MRRGGLRLDLRDAALAPAESGAAVIVPGRADESELVRRVLSDDPAERMPPDEANRPLSAAQKELFRRWVDEGAEWREHWSFVPPARAELPAVQDAAWPRNAIDYFILARLEAEGLRPSAEADRPALVRRLSLDLTGLPPTLAEIDAFLADDGPDAQGQLVERTLASPHHGERMALEWLDAARYADTHGYHIDSGRDMTRWREWVIEAFNDNLPFDRFTVEQLAGDLLPDATLEQKIASGFNRNHMINFEGGAIPEEYHTAYIVDRVNTTSTVWLGLTVGCAQCHDHKYDPLTQREFYQLFAFFHNVPENGLDGSKGNAAPVIPAPREEDRRRLEDLSLEIAELEAQLAGPLPEVDAAQAAWERTASAAGESWTALDPLEYGSRGGATLTPQDDLSLLASGENPAQETYTVMAVLGDAAKTVTGVRLEALPHESFVANGPGRSVNGNIVLTEVRIEAADVVARAEQRPLAIAQATADFSQETFPVTNAIDGQPTTGWALDPAYGRPHAAVFELAEPLAIEAGTALVVTLEFHSQFAQHQLGRFRLSVTGADNPHSAGELPAEVRAALAVQAAERNEQQAALVRDYYRDLVSNELSPLREALADARRRQTESLAAIPTAMVMQEMPQPRETFLLMRGEYDKPGDRVQAGVPAFLPPLPEGASHDRLALAQWLVDPRHPLTARVIVNRYWQMYFGTGLVKTSEDFGAQGEPPSHPQLLDWLAREFVDSGWDVRHIQRLIVTSATYRQRSQATPALLAHDPENRLLARGPRLRLSAEGIRDTALAVSGLLDARIGGASVSPYQPPGIWEELASRADGANWTAQVYEQSSGADLYRRTMYTFWKRTAPPPTLTTFDAPDRETCTVRRARTNTPLQALVLMNDPTYVEAARKLAERIVHEGGTGEEERIAFAFRVCTARLPNERETAVLRRVFQEQLAAYAADPQAAEELLSVGESPRDASLDAAELAAWAVVASVILNLDETVTKG